jgi:Lrp/AsnC family transcriptional regulator, leucine-responsive regulatory protein
MHNLDKKDVALIRELDFNARTSISILARKIRVSKEVANYRIKKLVENEVISGFKALIDPFMLGYQLYGLHLKLKAPSDQKKQELCDWAKNSENISEIIWLGGKWDFYMTFWAKNPSEFNKIFENFLLKFGPSILKKTISISVEIEHQPYNFLYDKPLEKNVILGEIGNEKIDKTDELILDLVSKDCRLSLMDIAKKTKLTANAVKYRLKNLVKRRIIKGYRTIINYEKFDLQHYRITLYLSDGSKKKEVKAYLDRQKDVVKITKMLGRGDMRFDILCESLKRVYVLIDDLNHKIPGVVRDFDERVTVKEEIIDYFPNY